MCGGVGLIKTLKIEPKPVSDPKSRMQALQLRHSIPGFGLLPRGREYMILLGPFLSKMFLIVIDAHSKWPEVIQITSTTAHKTIEALQVLFSRYGLPAQLVSYKGPQITAEEFADFVKANGIKDIRSAPYHPSTNGLAERFVQTFKKAIKAGEQDGLSLTT